MDAQFASFLASIPTLSVEESTAAKLDEIGSGRRMADREAGLVESAGAHGTDGGEKRDLDGAWGEGAVAHYVGLFARWHETTLKRPGTPGAPSRDICGWLEVRACEMPRRSPRGSSLIVRPGDPDMWVPFVLAWVDRPGRRVALPGWLWSHEVKRMEWAWRAPNGRPPAWFVPALDSSGERLLRPMEALR